MKSAAFLSFLLLSLLGGAIQVNSHGGNPNIIHACANKSSGELKIITPDELCGQNETPLHWEPAGSANSQPGVRFLTLLSRMDAVEHSNLDDFEYMPGMTASFQTSVPGCVTATFSAFVDENNMFVRLLLDDELMEGHGTRIGSVVVPDEMFMVASSSYTFWKCNVDSGSYIVKVQWRGLGVVLVGRTLVVMGP